MNAKVTAVARVYLETSFFSECATIRTGVIDQGRRATGLKWWQTQSHAFDLCISAEVARELLKPDFPAAVREPALSMLSDLQALALTEEVARVARLLVVEKAMPGPATEGDAVHLACCIVHDVGYLLTWNQKHLANPNKRAHLSVICNRLSYRMPEIVTPDLMIVEDL